MRYYITNTFNKFKYRIIVCLYKGMKININILQHNSIKRWNNKINIHIYQETRNVGNHVNVMKINIKWMQKFLINGKRIKVS